MNTDQSALEPWDCEGLFSCVDALIEVNFNFVKLRLLKLVRILIIDFYDSFVYNLVHYFESLEVDVQVIMDGEVSPENLDFLNEYSGVVLSPGPGLPHETRCMMAVIAYCQGTIPIFGVCLGMQGLGQHLGAKLNNLSAVRHGISKPLVLTRETWLFKDIKSPIVVGLYHSWGFTEIFEKYLVAKDDEGVVMAIASDEDKFLGVQFHPESVMTDAGLKIIENVRDYFVASQKNK